MGIYLQGEVVYVLTAPPSTAEQIQSFCKGYVERKSELVLVEPLVNGQFIDGVHQGYAHGAPARLA